MSELEISYATLSCISSLAVAPMLPIWKLSPTEYYRQEQDRHAVTLVEDEHIDQALMAAGFYTYVLKKRLKESQTRARVVLSVAILLQVRSICAKSISIVHLRHKGRSTVGLGHLSVCLSEIQSAQLQWGHYPRHVHVPIQNQRHKQPGEGNISVPHLATMVVVLLGNHSHLDSPPGAV
jgi:hypothetical protein